jgi:uncharacterized protein YggE
MITRATIRVAMRYTYLIMLLACAGSAQTADGVTVTVTRTVNVTPDEAEFSAIVTATLDTTEQQVTQALQDVGISNPVVIGTGDSANTYSYPPPNDAQVLIQISFTTPPAALKDVSKKLDALRANLPAGLTSFQYAAVLGASQAAVDAAHKNALAALLADARGKAELLAAAAGVKLGAILGVTESFYNTGGAPAGAYLITGTAWSVGSSSGSFGGAQYTFYAGVKFAAL